MTDLIIKQILLTESNDTVELFLHDSSGKAIYFEQCKETVGFQYEFNGKTLTYKI